MRRRDDETQPPAELLDPFRGGVAFYPGRLVDDPVVVAAVEQFRARLAAWCAARATWSREHGWPGGDEARVAEEEDLAGEFGPAWDPTAI